MKLKILLCLMLFSSVCSAQAPWRAKLFVHFLDSNNQIVTDTVCFGCDSLGAEGFQSGLDVIDTSLQWNKVYSADELIKTKFNTDCANLKTNIREFRTNISFFFYAIGNPVSISWDTLDYFYKDSVFPLVLIELESLNGYLNTNDNVKFDIGGDTYIKNGNEYIYQGFYFNQRDSIKLIQEVDMPATCAIQKGFNFKLNVLLSYVKLAINPIDEPPTFSLYPNPVKNTLNIRFGQLSSGLIKLTNYLGIDTIVVNYTQIEQASLELSKTPSGLYYLTIIEKNNQKTHTQKIIIQH